MMEVAVALDFPTFSGSLKIPRAPQFLRFTLRGPSSKGAWDCLEGNQTPKADEQVFAAARGDVVRKVTRYRLIDDGPGEDVLRDVAAWQRWCIEQTGEVILHSSGG